MFHMLSNYRGYSKLIDKHLVIDPPKQDIPPTNGFTSIPYKRNLPLRGPPGWMLIFGLACVTGIGFYYSRKGYHIQWELEREMLQARLHLEPFLQAEKDRFYLRAREISRQLERETMKNVSDWNMNEPMYHHSSVKYIPEYLIIPPSNEPVYPSLKSMADDPFRP